MAEDLSVIVESESAFYRERYGWDHDYEASVSRTVSSFARDFAPGQEEAWVADSVDADGRTQSHAGHVFLTRDQHNPQAAHLQLLLVEPSAQSQGLGRALVKQSLQFARAAKYHTVTLQTQSILTAATRIFTAEGFVLLRQTAHHTFGQELLEQVWQLQL